MKILNYNKVRSLKDIEPDDVIEGKRGRKALFLGALTKWKKNTFEKIEYKEKPERVRGLKNIMKWLMSDYE